MQKCKLCGEETKNGFNIDFKLVPICENCANSIFLQQAAWFVEEGGRKKDTEPVEERSMKQAQVIFCNCGQMIAAMMEPECYEDEGWLREVRKQVMIEGKRSTFIPVNQVKVSLCKCKPNAIKKKND